MLSIFQEKLLTQEINESLLSIKHRGPDGDGVWINKKKYCSNTFRLSILDLSNNASQPLNQIVEDI